MIKADLVVIGGSELRTCDPGVGEGDTGRIDKGAVAVVGDLIAWVGPESEMSSMVELTPDTIEIDADGRAIVPGFIDAHTHPIFAGSRRDEFAARARGSTYQTGGILTTVAATRAATTKELTELVRNRLDAMLLHGTTTVEAKSGYALDPDGEIRLLEILAGLQREHAIDIEITFLGAHAVPPETKDKPDEFIDLMCDTVPRAARLARWCDVFCDEGAFTPAQSQKMLEVAKAAGLSPRIHANELAPSGGARVAALVEAASADHLIHLTAEEARALASAGVVGIVCPVTALGLGHFADMNMMRDQGMTVAIASDFNPGTAFGENLQFAIAIGTRSMSIGPEEALVAVTRNAAASLRRDDIGRICPGLQADFMILNADSALDLGYHAGVNLVAAVVKRGRPFRV